MFRYYSNTAIKTEKLVTSYSKFGTAFLFYLKDIIQYKKQTALISVLEV